MTLYKGQVLPVWLEAWPNYFHCSLQAALFQFILLLHFYISMCHPKPSTILSL